MQIQYILLCRWLCKLNLGAKLMYIFSGNSLFGSKIGHCSVTTCFLKTSSASFVGRGIIF